MRLSYLGVPLDFISQEETIAKVECAIQRRQAYRVYFLNAHCYNQTISNEAYLRALDLSDIILPDGVGILWGAHQLGLPHRQNLNGTDLLPRLCRELASRRACISIYLLGGRPGVAKQAAVTLQDIHRNIRVVGTHHGYFAHTAADSSEIV